MITGSLTLNGLDDEDMQLIFEMRAKTPLLFNPSGTTIRTKPGVAAKPGHIQAYNNVVMGRRDRLVLRPTAGPGMAGRGKL
jgi:hypothetical protein